MNFLTCLGVSDHLFLKLNFKCETATAVKLSWFSCDACSGNIWNTTDFTTCMLHQLLYPVISHFFFSSKGWLSVKMWFYGAYLAGLIQIKHKAVASIKHDFPITFSLKIISLLGNTENWIGQPWTIFCSDSVRELGSHPVTNPIIGLLWDLYEFYIPVYIWCQTIYSIMKVYKIVNSEEISQYWGIHIPKVRAMPSLVKMTNFSWADTKLRTKFMHWVNTRQSLSRQKSQGFVLLVYLHLAEVFCYTWISVKFLMTQSWLTFRYSKSPVHDLFKHGEQSHGTFGVTDSVDILLTCTGYHYIDTWMLMWQNNCDTLSAVVTFGNVCL